MSLDLYEVMLDNLSCAEEMKNLNIFAIKNNVTLADIIFNDTLMIEYIKYKETRNKKSIFKIIFGR